MKEKLIYNEYTQNLFKNELPKSFKDTIELYTKLKNENIYLINMKYYTAKFINKKFCMLSGKRTKNTHNCTSFVASLLGDIMSCGGKLVEYILYNPNFCFQKPNTFIKLKNTKKNN